MKKIIIFGLLIVFLISGCRTGDLYELTEKWYYQLDDDSSARELKTRGSLETLVPGKTGYITLTNSFIVPDSFRDKNLSLYLGRILTVDETKLNGIIIGSTGHLPPRFFSGWNQTRVYSIPNSLLKPNENRLEIRVFVHGEGALLGKQFIGETIYARSRAFSEDFFNSYINAFIFIVMIIFGFYHLLIYLKRKNDVENLFYSLLAISFAIYETNFFVSLIPDPLSIFPSYLFFQKIIFISQYFVAFFLAYFIKTFTKHKSWRLTDIVLIFALIIPVVPHLFFFDYGKFREFTRTVQVFLFVPVFYILFVVIYSLRKKKREAVSLLFGILPLLIFVFIDVIAHQVLNLNDLIYFSGLGFPVFLIAVLFLMANKFVNYHNEFERLNVKLARKNSELEQLYDASLEMSSEITAGIGNSDSLYFTIMKLACGFADAESGCFFVLNENGDSLKLVVNYPGTRKCSDSYLLKKNSILRRCIERKKPILINNESEDDEALAEYELKGSYIILPITIKGSVFGIITIYNKKGHDDFNVDDFTLLNAFSSAASVTVENEILSVDLISKNRLEEEMKIAQKIQTAILPKIFDNEIFDISGLMIPAEEVGGDYFDFIVDESGREWFCVGDVTSHGVTPGLIMMMSQSIINTVVNIPGITPGSAVTKLNKILFENIKNRLGVSEFMTFSIFCHTGDGKFITAGKHIDYLIYRSGTEVVERVQTNGMWVGVMADITSRTREDSFELASGDVLFLYTDGVTEAPDSSKNLYGMQRLMDILKNNGKKNSADIVESIRGDLVGYMHEQDDDITMLCIRRK